VRTTLQQEEEDEQNEEEVSTAYVFPYPHHYPSQDILVVGRKHPVVCPQSSQGVKEHLTQGKFRPSTTLVRLGKNAAVSEYQ
jgi:hypothetical protein